jgi:hypothetical protein
MQRLFCLTCTAFFFVLSPCHAGFFDDLSSKVTPLLQQQSSLDNGTVTKGLKEALAKSTERAVAEVAKPDGYFKNQLVKILLPDRIQQGAELLGKFGYQQQVDELVLSMNRAAEKAAPKAAGFFGDAIRQMTMEDAKGILSGGETAATRFFENKTRTQLLEAFKPSVVQSMNQVGTVRAYKEMIGKFQNIPFASMTVIPSLDLDTYVTNKALDGLFTMVAKEEKNIRTNPAAQTTDLLRKVFGSK